jgi:hypothetical protein
MQASTLVYFASAGRQLKRLDDGAAVIFKQITIY